MQNILIADDSEDLLDLFESILKRKNFTVETTSSSSNLIDRIEKKQPDLIILDIKLGDYNGLEICKELKSKEKYSAIPILIMSGNPAKLKEYKEYNADDIIEKPFSIDEIVSKIRMMVC